MSSLKRRLAAIVFTDIVGFTNLSSKDEEGAYKLVVKQRKILKPIVENHEGQWLKEEGDALLLSFPSTKQAVNCSIQIQEAVKDLDNLNLRIGIHQGDIIIEMNGGSVDDIYEYMHRLSEFNPGDEVKVKVLRENNEKTVTVKF